MVEADRNPGIREINKQNIDTVIQFPPQDGGIPNALTINGINGDDIVNAVNGCVGKGLSVDAGRVLELLGSLKETPPTVEQMGRILNACTDGMTNISNEEGSMYSNGKLLRISQLRTLEYKLRGPFDIAVNKRLNNKGPQESLGTSS